MSHCSCWVWIPRSCRRAGRFVGSSRARVQYVSLAASVSSRRSSKIWPSQNRRGLWDSGSASIDGALRRFRYRSARASQSASRKKCSSRASKARRSSGLAAKIFCCASRPLPKAPSRGANRWFPGLSIDTRAVVLEWDFAWRTGWIRSGVAGGRSGLSWLIRSFDPTDLDALVALVGRSMERPWPRAKLAPALIGPGARVWLAEDEAGRLTGFVVARRVDDLLEIDLVGVDPRCRREGIARALLRATLAAEADAGLSEVRLEVVAGNRAALRLYEALDFVVVGRRKRYYPDGDDGLLLSWRKTRAG
ncbi:MAG: hypothetical protein CL908_05970 [Deltaproteobacteria bacterium]|nr:hypothetical protein [Deltaproteobacteria bacterium]